MGKIRELTIKYKDLDTPSAMAGLPPVEDPFDVVDLLRELIQDSPQEIMGVLALDPQNNILAWREISKGTMDMVTAHPRDIFQTVIMSNAASFILAHSHPVGNVEPSQADLVTTERVMLLGDLLGVPLVDHFIIGGEGEVQSIKNWMQHHAAVKGIESLRKAVKDAFKDLLPPAPAPKDPLADLPAMPGMSFEDALQFINGEGIDLPDVVVADCKHETPLEKKGEGFHVRLLDDDGPFISCELTGDTVSFDCYHEAREEFDSIHNADDVVRVMRWEN